MAAGEDVFELSLEPCWRDDARRAYSMILEMGDRIMTITEREVDELLSGAIDMHVHAFPDPEIDTGWDQINIAKRATEAGMGGVVYKAHTFPTAATAPLVQQVVDDYARSIGKEPARVYGGIVLNNYVGGLNPASVEMAIKLGGKVVWLPSHHSAHHRQVMGQKGGIRLLDDNGEPVPAAAGDLLHGRRTRSDPRPLPRGHQGAVRGHRGGQEGRRQALHHHPPRLERHQGHDRAAGRDGPDGRLHRAVHVRRRAELQQPPMRPDGDDPDHQAGDSAAHGRGHRPGHRRQRASGGGHEIVYPHSAGLQHLEARHRADDQGQSALAFGVGRRSIGVTPGMVPPSIVKFRVEFLSRDVPDDERVGQLRQWCVRFDQSGLTPPFEGVGRSLGNLSFRLRPNDPAFVITASTLMSKQDLTPADFVTVFRCDLERRTVYAAGARDPSSESLMHFEIYNRRPDVAAIFHGHDKQITARAALLDLPETEEFRPPGTPELLAQVMAILDEEPFLVMKNHGFLSLGPTMDEAGNQALQIREKLGGLRDWAFTEFVPPFGRGATGEGFGKHASIKAFSAASPH